MAPPFARQVAIFLGCGLALAASRPAAAEAPAAPGAAVPVVQGEDEALAKNRARTAIELGVLVGGGAAWYWIDRDRQVADWDFPSWRDRFSTDIFIHDTNPFMVNKSWHAIGGAAYHLAGRSNGLGVIESSLWALAASLAWEYGVEYREKVDLNDLIYTTPTGIAGGEFLYWLGRLLEQAPQGAGYDALRWTLGFPQTLHAHLDGRRGPRGPRVSHAFRVSSGAGAARADMREGGERSRESAGLYQLRFEGELQALAPLLPPGTSARSFRDANFTSLRAQLTATADGDRGTFVVVDTVVAGWRRTDIGEGGAGTALNLGTAVGIRYQRERYGRWNDRVGVAHLPGLALDGDLYASGFRLRTRARVQADYAGVHALSARRWRAAHPDEIGKSILEKQGYYFGWGASARLEAEISAGRFDLGGGIFYGRYRSQQGFDRFQEEVTVDQLVRDRVLDYELWARARLVRRLFLEARASGQERSERFEELTAGGRLRRFAVELGTSF